MPTVKLRKVGGSVSATIPPAILDALSLAVGAEMRVEADNGRVVMVPVVARRKPSLAGLLAECDFKKRRTRDEQSEIDAWETIKPVGREVF